MPDRVEVLTGVADRLRAVLPDIAVAAALLLAGWIVGRLLRALTTRLLTAWNDRLAAGVGRLFGSRDLESSVRRGTADRVFARAVGSFVFWATFLFFATAATEALGLSVVSALLSGLTSYLPQLLAGAVIVLFGALLGGVVRGAATAAASRAGVPNAAVIGRLAQVVVVTLSTIVAFDQLGLDVTFLIVVIAVVAGALLGGAALAFGLGARTSVSNILGAHYVMRTYRVGQRVRIGEVEGQIAEITPTGVLVRTGDGRVLIPAKDFNEQVSVLLTD